MANELYIEQRSGNGPLQQRKITPTANQKLGFNSNKQLVSLGGDASVQTITASTAVSLSYEAIIIDSTSGAQALTLADGAPNQRLVLSMIADGGDATLTPTHLQGGTTLTFNDAGDTAHLIFLGTKWRIISNNLY